MHLEIFQFLDEIGETGAKTRAIAQALNIPLTKVKSILRLFQKEGLIERFAEAGKKRREVCRITMLGKSILQTDRERKKHQGGI